MFNKKQKDPKDEPYIIITKRQWELYCENYFPTRAELSNASRQYLIGYLKGYMVGVGDLICEFSNLKDMPPWQDICGISDKYRKLYFSDCYEDIIEEDDLDDTDFDED